MAKSTVSKPAEADPMTEFDNSVPEGFEDSQQTTFPPYWPGEVGMTFMATVLGRDDSNPEFQRYVLRALRPTLCYRGPKAQAERVTVQTGEVFNCSVWTALKLDDYVGIDVFVTAKPNLPAKTPAGFVRDFELKTTKEGSRMLAERRRELMQSNPL